MTDHEAIERNQDEFVERGNAGDVEGVMACCTDDIVLMPPNAPAVVGADAVRPWLAEVFEQFTTELSTTTDDIVVSGDLAYARRSFEWTLEPRAGGERFTETGKVILIYKRGPDGTWKAAVDMWNTNEPAG